METICIILNLNLVNLQARECANKEILRPSFEVGPGFYWVEEGGWNDGGYSHLKVIRYVSIIYAKNKVFTKK